MFFSPLDPSLSPAPPSSVGMPAAAALSTLMLARCLTTAAAASTEVPAATGSGPGASATLPEVVVKERQDPGYQPETVFSPRYTEPLLNVPQTITVIPRAVIDEQGANSLSEVLRNVPGVTLLAGEGGGASNNAGDAFFMRGFEASNSIFVDGVRNQGLITRDVFNLEQVEVFKGPTGTDVGRGTAAGYLNLATKSPLLEALYGGTLGYGSAEQKRVTLDLNQPLRLGGADAWARGTAVRLNALWQEGGIPGRDEVERSSWALAPSVAFGLGTATRAILSTQHTRQENLPDYGLPGAALNGMVGTNALSRSIDRENFYGSAVFDFEDVSQDSVTARLEHDLSESSTLRNQTHFGRTDRFAVITSPGNVTATNTVARSRQANERLNQILSNQTTATASFDTGPLSHAVVGGFEYLREEQFTPTVTGAGTAPAADAFRPNAYDPVTGFAPQRTGAFTEGQTDTFSLFANDTLDFAEKWKLSGGLRWDAFSTEFRSVNTNGVAIAGTPLEVSDQLLSAKAGLAFKPQPNGTVYFSYGRTLTPPGTANFNLSTNLNNANNPIVEPQAASNFELGAKWDLLDSRLSLNAAIFRTINENEITTDNTTTPPTFLFDSERRVDGLEFGVAGRFTEGWQVFANLSYLDATFAESANPTQDGARLQWTPDFSASLWTTYRFPFRLTVGGGARYVSTIQRQTTTTAAAIHPEAPEYWVLDAMAQYEVSRHLTLRLNVYNLLDEFYPLSLNNNGNRFNPGPPLSAMLTASLKF
ncbi:MAG: TonB-dependent siderophore receptor [Verrucomicrobiales bacterium]|nr:TonB-dependent siderophore receptor [Verrucomicrobiales bacterium]